MSPSVLVVDSSKRHAAVVRQALGPAWHAADAKDLAEALQRRWDVVVVGGGTARGIDPAGVSNALLALPPALWPGLVVLAAPEFLPVMRSPATGRLYGVMGVSVGHQVARLRQAGINAVRVPWSDGRWAGTVVNFGCAARGDGVTAR